jgi:CTP:molybdopterin cytidylyltransferase MocA
MIAPGPIPPDVQKAIDQFHTEADKIIQPFVEGLKAKKPPPLIYHYTGDVGLRGILETGQLRLTDVLVRMARLAVLNQWRDAIPPAV